MEALSEVVTALILFIGCQNEHVLRSNKQHMTVSLTSQNNEIINISFKVNVSGLGSYFINGTNFLKTIVRTCSYIQRLGSNSIIQSVDYPQSNNPSIKLICQRIGDYSTVSNYELSLPCGSDLEVLDIQESVSSRCVDFGGLALEIEEIALSSESVKGMVWCIQQQLYLIHIVNPEVAISLHIKLPSIDDAFIEYEIEPSTSIHTSPFKLASAIENYINNSYSRSLTANQKKIKLIRGSTIHITDYKLKGVPPVSLKLYCCVGILPYLRLKKGKKIPAQRICDKLHVTVFGPGNIPLVPAGSQANFNIEDLAHWSDYRIDIGTPIKQTPRSLNETSPYNPSFSFNLSPSTQRLLLTPSSSSSSTIKPNRTLQIFFFIEEDITDTQVSMFRHSSEQKWEHNMQVLFALRNDFGSFVSSESKKIQKVFHSGLNKLLYNYGSFMKVSSNVNTAIPVVSEAVASIINHSSNELFKEKCLELIQRHSMEDIEPTVLTKLKEFARTKLNITDDNNTMIKGPEEPTTPELESAIIDTPDDTREVNSQKKRRLSVTDHDVTESQDTSHLDSTDVYTSPQRFSLFSARIAQRENSNKEIIDRNGAESDENLLVNSNISSESDFESLATMMEGSVTNTSTFTDTISRGQSSSSHGDDFDSLAQYLESEQPLEIEKVSKNVSSHLGNNREVTQPITDILLEADSNCKAWTDLETFEDDEDWETEKERLSLSPNPVDMEDLSVPSITSCDTNINTSLLHKPSNIVHSLSTGTLPFTNTNQQIVPQMELTEHVPFSFEEWLESTTSTINKTDPHSCHGTDMCKSYHHDNSTGSTSTCDAFTELEDLDFTGIEMEWESTDINVSKQADVMYDYNDDFVWN